MFGTYDNMLSILVTLILVNFLHHLLLQLSVTHHVRVVFVWRITLVAVMKDLKVIDAISQVSYY